MTASTLPPSSPPATWTDKLLPGYAQIAHDRLLADTRVPDSPLNIDSWDHPEWQVRELLAPLAVRMSARAAAAALGVVECPFWWWTRPFGFGSAEHASAFLLLWHVKHGRRVDGALVSEHLLPAGAVVRHETVEDETGARRTRIAFARLHADGSADWTDGVHEHGGFVVRPCDGASAGREEANAA